MVLFLNFFVFTLSLISSFFMLACKEEEEEFWTRFYESYFVAPSTVVVFKIREGCS